MSHILFKSNSLLPSCTVEFHVFSKKTLDGGNGFFSQKCTEDSADSDAVESVEDCKERTTVVVRQVRSKVVLTIL